MGKIKEIGNYYHLQYYSTAKGYSVTETTGLKISPKNYKKAEVLLRKIEKAKDEGIPILAPKAKKTMMVELLELVRDHYKIHGLKDLYSVEIRLDLHLIKFFLHFRAVAVTTEIGWDYVKHRQAEGAAASTINKEISHLSMAFKLGQELNKIGNVPKFKTLKENNVRKGFRTQGEHEQICLNLKPEIEAIAVLDSPTGMRRGEILKTLWDQIDLKECCIRLEDTKNGEAREIHYGENPEIKAMVDRQWEQKLITEAKTGKKITHLFFRYNTGKPIKDFRVAWKTACEKAGIIKEKGLKDKTLFHNYRRSAIRSMTQLGIPRGTIKLISGHESDSAFDRYNIRDPKDTRAALGKVSSVKKSEVSSEISSEKLPFEAPEPIQ